MAAALASKYKSAAAAPQLPLRERQVGGGGSAGGMGARWPCAAGCVVDKQRSLLLLALVLGRCGTMQTSSKPRPLLLPDTQKRCARLGGHTRRPPRSRVARVAFRAIQPVMPIQTLRQAISPSNGET